MSDVPTSLIDLQRRFPNEAACAAWLFIVRSPADFRYPACGHAKEWLHGGKPFTSESAATPTGVQPPTPCTPAETTASSAWSSHPSKSVGTLTDRSGVRE